MIDLKRLQLTFWDGWVQTHIADLWEPWMRHADTALEDPALLEIVQSALMQRCRKSKTRGRPSKITAESAIRLLLLKHMQDLSFQQLVWNVRANMVYREFTRIGDGAVPNDKSISRIARQLAPQTIEQIHRRIVTIAFEKKVVAGSNLRVDTTVVETNIHYPTDSKLLNDGVRVLTREMRRIAILSPNQGTPMVDHTRAVKFRVLDIARASRDKSERGKLRMAAAYKDLLDTTARVVRRAEQFSQEITGKIKRGKRNKLKRAQAKLDQTIPLLRKVMHQTTVRIFEGNTHADKIVSLFEPQTEVIRKGKASKPTEFGKMVKIQEAESQIITHYQVFALRPSDSDLLVGSVVKHIEIFGKAPRVVAADTGFFSAANEKAVQQLGVAFVAVPSKGTKSAERKQTQKKRWFKKAQRWRTGCEGRISVIKRRHGLNRSRYKGQAGMERWTGLGVIADNLINIGIHLADPER